MLGEIITTGTELITGRVADANACYAARRLHDACLNLQSITILGDDAQLLGDALRRAVARSRFIIITGGLGPTDDDLTVAAAAQALNLKLFLDEGLLARIRRCLAERRIPWEDRYARLALIPQGATILDPGGMACGFSLHYRNSWLFFLPGVPREMHLLFDTFVLPTLMDLAGRGHCLEHRTLRLFGLTEAELQEIISRLNPPAEVAIGFYPNFPETHLTLTATGPQPQALSETLDRFTQLLAQQVGEMLIGPEADTLEELVGVRLKDLRRTLAVAESCTGGLICQRLTAIPGASDYFLGGVVAYSNQAKIDLLRVPQDILAHSGAVSAATAEAMAQGAKEVFNSSYALAVTGIAGPTGGSPQKPVGTVYIALANRQHVQARRYHFHGNREQIRTLAAQTALDWLRRELSHAARLSGH